MSRKLQTNSSLHKYLIASEWKVLQNPSAPYAEKLMTILRVKEKLGDVSKQGPHTKFIVEEECRRNAVYVGMPTVYRLRRRRTNP